MKKKKITLIEGLGLLGALLWGATILLRETTLIQNDVIGFVFGIAPNFAVGLLLPAMCVIGYSLLFGKEMTFKQFFVLLIGVYIVLLASEVVHYKFLNSSYDNYDMVASLIALGIMSVSYQYRKAKD